MNNVNENNINQNDMIAHLQQLAASSSAPAAQVAIANGEAVAVDHLFFTQKCTFCTTDSPENAA